MKIVILDKENAADEDEIVIKCDTLDENIMQLLNSLKNGKDTLSLYSGTAIALVDTKEVLYFESVDDRVFAYTAEQVYEAKQKLYQLEESLPDDFLRANKAVIVNVRKLETLRPDFGGRIEATLCNGCAVIFSGIHGSVSLSYIWGVLLLSAILTAARLPFLKEKEMPRIPFLLWNIVYIVFANGVVLTTGLWLGWFSLAHPITIIAMELLFVIIFITVWTVMYLSLRHSTEKMNSQLQKFKT